MELREEESLGGRAAAPFAIDEGGPSRLALAASTPRLAGRLAGVRRAEVAAQAPPPTPAILIIATTSST